MGTKVDYKFNMDEIVEVIATGDKGVVTMLGYDDAGPQYYVKFRTVNQWWKERQLKETGAAQNAPANE
jgi:hypothetical protein